MHIPLSKRLQICCKFISPGSRVADIGCDHGYLGIYLLHTGIATSVIASDVREGPLECAIRNAGKYGVRDKMVFYLSDGVRSIPRDFDVMVCAGMGGDTMISILEAAPWLKSEQYRLILQCQSKTPMLRKFLWEQGWQIQRESLAKDGKFVYSVLEAVYAPGGSAEDWEYYISKPLLEGGNPLLKEYYQRLLGGLRLHVEGLQRNGNPDPAQEALLKEIEGLEERI